MKMLNLAIHCVCSVSVSVALIHTNPINIIIACPHPHPPTTALRLNGREPGWAPNQSFIQSQLSIRKPQGVAMSHIPCTDEQTFLHAVHIH